VAAVGSLVLINTAGGGEGKEQLAGPAAVVHDIPTQRPTSRPRVGVRNTPREGAPTPRQDSRSTPSESGSSYGAAPIGTTRYPIPAGALFVSPSGSDSGKGTIDRPWRTLSHAVAAAPAGSTIVLRQGVYHEYVHVYGKRLTIQPYPGEAVWFDGSEVVTGWVKDGSAWRVDGWTARFDNTDPTHDHPDPDFRMVDPRYPMSRYPDQVFLNGKQLRQVGSRDAVQPGTFYVDYDAQRLYIGSDPAQGEVRASTLAEALYLNHAHGSVVRGIGFRRYATPLKRYGTVKGFGDNLVFENVVIADNATDGLKVSGTGITVRRSSLLRNGKLGLTGHRANGVRFLGNAVEGNNRERFKIAPEAGGIKVTSSQRVTVAGNRADDNLGVGIWIDQEVTDAVISRNLVRRNAGHGIQFEISDGALIVGNVVADNQRFGIRINEASRARIWHNTAVGNRERQIDLVDGGRRGSGRVSMDVHDIEIHNNLMEGGPATKELLGVEDYTGRRTAGAMTTLDGNAYYQTGNDSRPLVRWVDRSIGSTSFKTLEEMRSRAGKEHNGLFGAGSAPFADRTTFRLQDGSAPTRGGVRPPAKVIELLGLAAGTMPAIGAVPLPVR